MTFEWTPEHFAYANEQTWAVLATGRSDGSPQQSMIGYLVDDEGRLVMSVKAYTAKWKNAVRQPKVSLTIPNGRIHMVVYGTAETISDDPERAELSSQMFAKLSGIDAPDPTSIISMLDEQERTILRITPTRVFYAE
jgi:PPOX class probable F420-dependent enzyme